MPDTPTHSPEIADAKSEGLVRMTALMKQIQGLAKGFHDRAMATVDGQTFLIEVDPPDESVPGERKWSDRERAATAGSVQATFERKGKKIQVLVKNKKPAAPKQLPVDEAEALANGILNGSITVETTPVLTAFSGTAEDEKLVEAPVKPDASPAEDGATKMSNAAKDAMTRTREATKLQAQKEREKSEKKPPRWQFWRQK